MQSETADILESTGTCLATPINFRGMFTEEANVFFGQAQIIHTHTVAVNIKFTFCFHSTIVVQCAPYKTQVV